MDQDKPIKAKEIPENKAKSLYPDPFASRVEGRVKRKIGDYFGLVNFGVNLTELSPGSMSALKHQHLKQDEFIYILSGNPTLIYGNNTYQMNPGDCVGFKAGNEMAHHLINKSSDKAVYLEIGDRTEGDAVIYPEDDLCAHYKEGEGWVFTHKNGDVY